MRYFLLCLLVGLAMRPAKAQDDLLNMLDEQDSAHTEYAFATFKSTRVVNGHSVEMMSAKHLDFRIHHRFGRMNEGARTLWGLDQATVRFTLEYGITDRLMVGVGRSSYQKTAEGFVKYRLLRQSSGKVNMPVTVVYFGDMAIDTREWTRQDLTETFARRVAYAHQIHIARKFSEALSLQLSPTLVHRNLAPLEDDRNDIWALGTGGRCKLTKRTSFNAEYYWRLPDGTPNPYYNSFAVGFDIETGGHVFQLHLTNAISMTEKGFIAETGNDWGRGDILFGFNISRVFSLKK